MTRTVENITLDDMVLVEKCQRGDTMAMQRLIVKYQDRVYNTILKICQNKEDAAELTQDAFVKFIEKISSFKGESSFYTWLFRIAVNMTLNHCKRAGRIRMQSLESSGSNDDEVRGQMRSFLQGDASLDPAGAAQNRELVALLYSCISQLGEEQRTILVLRDIEGMNYDQIAETLGLELGTVKSRLSRARAGLKDLMTKACE